MSLFDICCFLDVCVFVAFWVWFLIWLILVYLVFWVLTIIWMICSDYILDFGYDSIWPSRVSIIYIFIAYIWYLIFSKIFWPQKISFLPWSTSQKYYYFFFGFIIKFGYTFVYIWQHIIYIVYFGWCLLKSFWVKWIWYRVRIFY